MIRLSAGVPSSLFLHRAQPPIDLQGRLIQRLFGFSSRRLAGMKPDLPVVPQVTYLWEPK